MLSSNCAIRSRKVFIWLVCFILGLMMNNSDARAVNISNTWTLPQGGFSVFYRFFRDQISWFEADAVCQFHHANLVTVTNSVEFDASREFLRILDVTEPIWIGLIRSQNSDRFFWSNSKPLGPTTEYWAESLPVIDAPLCAVIDPVRDYRWHALRCGGPETASFLCEMNVPSWAEECVIRDIPALTIQYMADSGSVEITKDCGNDEGIKHQVCRGKQDLDRIINSLVCKNEKLQQEISQIFSHQRQNLIINSDLLNSHKKSIEIIKNTHTNNNEDNNINLQENRSHRTNEFAQIIEQETENPVQKLIEQFDVEELMQADQPHNQYQSKVELQQEQQPSSVTSVSDEMTTTTSTIGTQKPLQNPKKKVQFGKKKSISTKPSKSSITKKKRVKNIALEDMMMGDQPAVEFGNDEDLNEIQQPLPHSKKMMPQDLRHEENSSSPENELINVLNEATADNIFEKINMTQFTNSTGAIDTIVSETEQSSMSAVINETAVIPTSNFVTTYDSYGYKILSNDSAFSTIVPTVEEKINFASTAALFSDIAIISSSTEETMPLINIENEPSSTLKINSFASDSAKLSTSHQLDLKPTPSVTIGHPMHPQQPRSNIISEETAHSHIKETNDNHFIPPMLMVKSHYQSPKSGLGHNIEHQIELEIVRKKTTPDDSESITNYGNQHHSSNDEPSNAITITTKALMGDANNANHYNTDNKDAKIIRTQYMEIKSEIADDTELNYQSTIGHSFNVDKISSNTLVGSESKPAQTRNDMSLFTTFSTYSTEGKLFTDKLTSASTPTFDTTLHNVATSTLDTYNDSKMDSTLSTDIIKIKSPNILTAAIEDTSTLTSTHESLKQNSHIVNTIDAAKTSLNSKSFEYDNDNSFTTVVSSSDSSYKEKIEFDETELQSTATHPTIKPIESSASSILKKNNSNPTSILHSVAHLPSASREEHAITHRNEGIKQSDLFSAEDEHFQQHKPNRRRTLTKPETTSYLKKILG